MVDLFLVSLIDGVNAVREEMCLSIINLQEIHNWKEDNINFLYSSKSKKEAKIRRGENKVN